MGISKAHLSFLKKLSKNNNRDWFAKNKPQFDALNIEIKSFFEAVSKDLGKSDNLESFKVYRIYRDVRFSKNKDPYKNHFSGHFKRATEARRGGYYIHIQPGNTYVGGGFWAPNKEDLLRIRKEFAYDDKPIRKILKSKKFIRFFGELKGTELKTVPRGFDIENPAIDLLRKKNYYVERRLYKRSRPLDLILIT